MSAFYSVSVERPSQTSMSMLISELHYSLTHRWRSYIFSFTFFVVLVFINVNHTETRSHAPGSAWGVLGIGSSRDAVA